MRIIMTLVMVLFLSACAKTTVVLLPDENGTVGEIEVTGAQASEHISTANGYTEVGSSERPDAVKTMSTAKIEKVFGEALQAEPQPPISRLLYFYSDQTTLKPESLKEIPGIAKEILAKPAPEVSIIGHSDAMGEKDYNLQLSLRRAETVKALLMKDGVPEKSMYIFSHGENDPLIPTADGVSEPKNRRVEVFIR
ncbi:OmpA family protein [Desulfovibrio inopinatus]|uniref:OmpA family protein n=1 Tax=Desulfovibrio inopinatus TaxID=102109 RepID=UPI00042240D0|nr:OmpA family protein [Desulfovibrio inopinatus]